MNKDGKLVNEKKINEFIYTGYFEDKPAILLLNKCLKNLNKKIVKIDTVYIDSEASSLLTINSKNNQHIILELILKHDEVETLDEIISLFANVPNEYYLKLRGDFAEAKFISVHGGEKIKGEQKFDINMDGKYIEIKSYSKSVGTVMVKNSQIVKGIKIVAANIYMDNLGETIIELAKRINDKEFSEELIKKYTNTKMENMRLNIDTFFIINPPKISQLESIKDMTIEFYVNNIIGEKYGK